MAYLNLWIKQYLCIPYYKHYFISLVFLDNYSTSVYGIIINKKITMVKKKLYFIINS